MDSCFVMSSNFYKVHEIFLSSFLFVFSFFSPPFVFPDKWKTSSQKQKKNKGHMEWEDVKQNRIQLADTILYPEDSLWIQRMWYCKFGRMQSMNLCLDECTLLRDMKAGRDLLTCCYFFKPLLDNFLTLNTMKQQGTLRFGMLLNLNMSVFLDLK